MLVYRYSLEKWSKGLPQSSTFSLFLVIVTDLENQIVFPRQRERILQIDILLGRMKENRSLYHLEATPYVTFTR